MNRDGLSGVIEAAPRVLIAAGCSSVPALFTLCNYGDRYGLGRFTPLLVHRMPADYYSPDRNDRESERESQ